MELWLELSLLTAFLTAVVMDLEPEHQQHSFSLAFGFTGLLGLLWPLTLPLCLIRLSTEILERLGGPRT